ncbi:hypothetical protein BKA70DRAFT_1449555 [Coprinopsis sp. MPI-PUGE-AT-0042]|nr:hypothetical protein BKA70DRAFT_1449555 [Coprinopsis sp. MPI-PUGE-AT-0042]
MNRVFPFISRNTTQPSVPNRPSKAYRDTTDPIDDDDSDTSMNAQAHGPVSSDSPFGESASASQLSPVSRPSSAARRRSRPSDSHGKDGMSDGPGVKCRIVARDDPQQQETMAKVLERLTAMESQMSKQDKKLTTQHKLLGEYREQLENQTLELKECREKLEHALQAQSTNKRLIEALREEVELKSCEIDVLKEDIRVRDGKISELSVSCANRIGEVEEEARIQMEASRSRKAAAREQLEDLRKAAEAAEVAEEVQPEDRMDTDEGMRVGGERQFRNDDRMNTNSPQAEGGTVGKEGGEPRSPLRAPVQQTQSAQGGRPALQTPRYSNIVTPPSKFAHSKSGSGPRYVLAAPPSSRTAPPSSTTASPSSATASPSSTTASPSSTTASSSSTTASSSSTTASPSPTAALPSSTTPLPEFVPLSAIKAKKVVRNPDPKRNELLGVVRAHMNMLMGISQDLDLLTSPAATEDTRAICDFEGGGAEEPALDPLRPCWSDLKSEWNAALTHKFVEYMIDEVGMNEEFKETIGEMFQDRLKRQRAFLRTNSCKEGEDEEARVTRLKQHKAKATTRDRATTRRTTLFKKRRLISSEARDDPEEAEAWKEIDRVVEELGAGGMSSDESEYDEYKKKTARTIIRSVPWRAEGIEELMKIVDRDAVTSTAGGFQRGGNPGLNRARKLAPVASRWLAMRGLPRNYYDEDWFTLLPARQQEALGALDPRPLPELKRDEQVASMLR